MELSNIQQRFILHWGEMGTKWGINRSVAQIHALLYLSPKPLHAEEISEVLSIARSNVSNSLRELQGWGIVKVTHVLGDRRDHFESLKDVWELVRVILEERKKREIDPTVLVLRELQHELETSKDQDKYTRERIGELLGFVESMSSFYSQIKVLPETALKNFIKFGAKIRKAVGGKE
jgi:DNA-binding transcriptional regulator GbsR (MarR family)